MGIGTRPMHGRETKEQLCPYTDTHRNTTLSLNNNNFLKVLYGKVQPLQPQVLLHTSALPKEKK